MNWMIDLCSILILNSIQGMVFGLILRIWYRISKTEQCLLLNYQALKWQAMSYLIPVAYILNRTFFYNGYVFSGIGWSRLMAGILCTVWGIGTLIFVGKYLKKCRSMWKIVCNGHAVSADIEEYLLRIKQEMGYKKRIRLVQLAQIKSPCVYGAFHHYLLLPQQEFSQAQLNIIFTHELTHLCQKDLWWKHVLHWISCIFWFLPWKRQRMQRYELWSELACDARSISRIQSEKEYFGQILSMMEHASGHLAGMGACLQEDKLTLLERMKRISAWRKSVKWKSWVFVVMCLSLCVCFPVSVLAAARGYQSAYTKVLRTTERSTEKDYHKAAFQQKGKTEDESEIVSDMEMQDSVFIENNVYGISWRIASDARNKTAVFYKESGELIRIQADSLEYGQLEAGIIYEDSQVEYVTGKDSIDMTFQIEKTGNYRVYVTNPNAYTMNVVGFYVR